jgi:hypothetical protein
MIEVPAAALLAEKMMRHLDFVSIGTNDLTQYTMAADRLSASLAYLTDPWQPAVLRLVHTTCRAGFRVSKTAVGVCGEAAADPLLACVLTGLGVNVPVRGDPGARRRRDPARRGRLSSPAATWPPPRSTPTVPRRPGSPPLRRSSVSRSLPAAKTTLQSRVVPFTSSGAVADVAGVGFENPGVSRAGRRTSPGAVLGQENRPVGSFRRH